MYAALPSQVFDRESDCGRCIRARGTEADAPGDWVTVRGGARARVWALEASQAQLPQGRLCSWVHGAGSGRCPRWLTHFRLQVMIVDECASCKGDGDVDFSSPALEAITGEARASKAQVERDFLTHSRAHASCPTVADSLPSLVEGNGSVGQGHAGLRHAALCVAYETWCHVPLYHCCACLVMPCRLLLGPQGDRVGVR